MANALYPTSKEWEILEKALNLYKEQQSELYWHNAPEDRLLYKTNINVIDNLLEQIQNR